MLRNFKRKLIGQVGEHLVVAELGRRGVIATPFAGNVPDIDILAYLNGKAIPIQVKAIATGTWQFDLSRYLLIDQEGDRQTIRGISKDIDPKLVCVLVKVGKTLGNDRFFILTAGDLQHIMLSHHSSYLKKHDGVRPSNPQSLHTSVAEQQLAEFRSKWMVIDESLGGADS